MPGIVGLITKMPSEQAASELHRMVAAVRHEPFYATGTWMDESLGAYVGWAVKKNSFADGMPISNEQGDTVLVFSGEEYPEPGTIERLKSMGHSFTPDKPSYLVHLYEEDPQFPENLNGQFHGLIMDRKRGIATLFNDRYGLHRIYYHESKDAFYFASEAKAILAVRPELRSPDPRGLGELVACGCVLENRTFFKNIHVLPPAASWLFRGGKIERKGDYFQPKEWEEQSCLSPDNYFQELRDCVAGILPRYFNGHEAIAVSLTGGLDTRVILAWRKSLPASPTCYTYGGMYRDCRDVVVARRVADSCGLSHRTIAIGKDFLERFPQYAERTVYLTDGSIGVDRSADLYFSERARQIAPVRIVGTYGSELLTQVPMFKPVDPEPGLFHAGVLPYVQQAKQTYAQLRRDHPVTFAAFRQSPWWHQGVLALEQTQLTVRSPFLDNAFVRTVFRSPLAAAASSDVRLRLIGEGDPALSLIRSDRGVGGEGQLSSKASHYLHEFTFKAEYAYDYGMPQWLARIDHLFSPFHFERLFLGRHKFAHYRLWYRDSLSNYIREMLLDSKTLTRPYLEPAGVRAMVQEHLKGHRNHTIEIHKVLTLELLHRLFFDGR